MRWASGLILLLHPALALGDETESVARLAVLWQQRQDPGRAEAALRLGTSALAERPDDPDLMFWTARFALWVGDTSTDPKQRKQLGREAWDVGDRLARARPGWVAGHYFGAAGIGLYCGGAGILTALTEGLDTKFTERLDRALALDPRFEHHGPGLAKGRYYFEMPWPKRSFAKSAAWYRRVLAEDPKNLRAMAWLAETMWREGDAAGALAVLANVQEGHIQGDAPEEERVKTLAQEIARRIETTGTR